MALLQQVVITGSGIIAPGISNKQAFKRILKEGICTQSFILNKNGVTEKLAAGVVDDECLNINGENYKRYARASRLAVKASLEAYEDASLSNIANQQRIAIVIGSAMGSILEIEQHAKEADVFRSFPVQGVSYVDSNTIANSVANALHLTGPVYTVSTGCTASLDAMLLGQTLLQTNQADVCIIGGTDASLGQWTINGFQKLRSLAKQDEIGQAGTPFSEEQNGFVLAEGAAMLVLERKEDAERRGQTIYAQIDGLVSRNEGLKVLMQDTTGEHMLEVLRETLDGQIPTYINSQALGMQINDQIEYKNSKELFNHTVPISSIKGMIGHTFGAMGAMQTIASIISIEEGFIPPTIKASGNGFEGLPIVFQTTYTNVESVCITAHSSSGNNTCLLISKI